MVALRLVPALFLLSPPAWSQAPCPLPLASLAPRPAADRELIGKTYLEVLDLPKGEEAPRVWREAIRATGDPFFVPEHSGLEGAKRTMTQFSQMLEAAGWRTTELSTHLLTLVEVRASSDEKAGGTRNGALALAQPSFTLLSPRVAGAAISPDSRYLVTTEKEGVGVYDLIQGKLVSRLPSDMPLRLGAPVFTADGKKVLYPGKKGLLARSFDDGRLGPPFRTRGGWLLDFLEEYTVGPFAPLANPRFAVGNIAVTGMGTAEGLYLFDLQRRKHRYIRGTAHIRTSLDGGTPTWAVVPGTNRLITLVESRSKVDLVVADIDSDGSLGRGSVLKSWSVGTDFRPRKVVAYPRHVVLADSFDENRIVLSLADLSEKYRVHWNWRQGDANKAAPAILPANERLISFNTKTGFFEIRDLGGAKTVVGGGLSPEIRGLKSMTISPDGRFLAIPVPFSNVVVLNLERFQRP